MSGGELDPDGLVGAPWFARLAARGGFQIVVALGLAAFILILFRYVTNDLAETAKANLKANQAIAQAMIDLSKVVQRIVDNQHDILNELRDHSAATGAVDMFILCSGRARSDAERQHCFEIIYARPMSLPVGSGK